MFDYVEPTFGLDEFRKPRVLRGWEALVQTLLAVLFVKPGFYPSVPDLGMYIQQYRYMKFNELDTEMIKADLCYQYTLLQEEITDENVDVRKTLNNGDPVLLFVISVTDDTKQSKVLVGVEYGEDEITYHYDLKDAVTIS